LRFTPCTGVPCVAQPDASNASIKERLERVSSGFILRSPHRQYIYAARSVSGGATVPRSFLTTINSRGGTPIAELEYADPLVSGCETGDAGSSRGTPYLSAITNEDGVRIVTDWDVLERPDATME